MIEELKKLNPYDLDLGNYGTTSYWERKEKMGFTVQVITAFFKDAFSHYTIVGTG